MIEAKVTAVKEKVIFDTNVFIKLDENNIEPSIVKLKFEVYSSNAQFSEFINIKITALRKRRLDYYEQISPIQLNLQSGNWNDNLIWDDEQPWIDDSTDVYKSIRGNSNNQNTWLDALIADVASRNDITLVVHDRKLKQRAIRNEIKVLELEPFLAILGE